jgi:hypothetical protein
MLEELIVSGANTEPSALKGGYMLHIRALYALIVRAFRLMLTEPHIRRDASKIEVPAL